MKGPTIIMAENTTDTQQVDSLQDLPSTEIATVDTNPWQERWSKPKAKADGTISEPRNLGWRMSLGAGEAGNHGTIAEYKASLKEDNPSLSNREIKALVAEHFGNSTNQRESEAKTQVALASLFAMGFTPENIDRSKRGTSATLRLKAPDKADELSKLVRLARKAGKDEEVKKILADLLPTNAIDI